MALMNESSILQRNAGTALYACSAFAFLLVLRYVYIEAVHRLRARRLGCGEIPTARNGPFGIPGMLRLLKADQEHRFPQFTQQTYNESRKTLGRIVSTTDSYMLGQRRIITTDAVNVRAILATQFKEFGLGKYRNNNLALLQGYGVFSSDGQQWEHSRAMLRPQFSREQINDLSLQAKHSNNMMQAIDAIAGSDGWTQTFDIQQIFFRFTMDSSTEFLFGKSLDSQIRPLNSSQTAGGLTFDEDEFIHAFDASLDYMTKGLRLGPFYKLAHTKECKRLCAIVHKLVDVYVHAALQRRNSQASADSEKKRYVLADALAAETQDPIEIRNHLLNVLIAGRDTTASLLGWLFLLLARQPEEYTRLRSEILQTFGPYDQPTNLPHSGLRSCAYLQHCLNEALRLFPLVPINFRKCLVPFTTLPTGGGPNGQDPIYVRENDDVVYSTYVMHRDPEFWDADANDFRPSRWDGFKPGWQFLPFNGGPRICLGQQFAITQASYVMIRLLQRFESIVGVDLPLPGQEKHHLTVTDACATGVNIKLKLA